MTKRSTWMPRTADSPESADADRSASGKEPLPVRLRRAAMDALARREHSFAELTRKLRTKFPDAPEEQIGQQLGRLREQGLQSDARFTEAYVRYRKTRGFAYLHIRADLLGRGVCQTLIEEHLFLDDEDWFSMAEELVAKRVLGEQDLSFGGKPHRKLLRFLGSRGFPPAISRRVLDTRFGR